MYSQSLFGPRWFLPRVLRENNRIDYYRDKYEILLIKPDADNVNSINLDGV